ncbi:MAG: ATPase domain-containing protein [Leptolyngbyaceae cyanobacterium bins.302]|nr:ATPase domain-containing protein [Leptolyngbyaceae cyanobacterium bins.302]
MTTTTDTTKKPEIDQVIKEINCKLGQRSIFQLKDSSRLRVTTFTSGIPALDEALGGGWPRGRIVEIFGHESSGKTTLALLAIKEVQEEGGTAAFFDMEHALDPDYAHRLGVA